MRNKKVLFITQGAVIAAIYVVLTYLVNLLGLANGVIQVRLSEALTILPVFTPAAIPGVFIAYSGKHNSSPASFDLCVRSTRCAVVLGTNRLRRRSDILRYSRNGAVSRT